MSRGGGPDQVAATAEEEEALWRSLRDSRSSARREQIFSAYAPFARQIAGRHYRDRSTGDIDLQDLRQLAFAGLLEAIDRFDPSRGAPFRAYAAGRITGSILDGIAKMSEVREQGAFRNRMRSERARSLAAADPDALSTLDAMEALVQIAEGLALGFMLEAGGLASSHNGPDERPSAYDSLAWKETLRQLTLELLGLPEHDQVIIRHHYHGGLTFDQIGALFGLSKGRISQLHRAAITQLRGRLAQPPDFSLKR